MHTHHHPDVQCTPEAHSQGMRATVTYEDGCTITFRSPSVTRWNGGWPVLFSTPYVGLWGAAEIDTARRAAFPEHR